MSLNQTKPNAAKETGGNLATSVVLLTSLETLAQTNKLILAELRLLNVQIAALSGQAQPPADIFVDQI